MPDKSRYLNIIYSLLTDAWWFLTSPELFATEMFAVFFSLKSFIFIPLILKKFHTLLDPDKLSTFPRTFSRPGEVLQNFKTFPDFLCMNPFVKMLPSKNTGKVMSFSSISEGFPWTNLHKKGWVTGCHVCPCVKETFQKCPS